MYLQHLLVSDLLNRALQHEGPSVDRAQPREALGQPAQAVHGVDVGRLPVPLEGANVQLDALDRLQRRPTGSRW